MPNKTKKSSNDNKNSSSFQSIVKKSFTAHSEWDKDEFLDVIYWLRQLLGILFGIVWGAIPLKGFIAILLFIFLSCGIIYLYCTSFHQIDEDNFEGVMEIMKEGFSISLSGFLVVWILIYNGLYF